MLFTEPTFLFLFLPVLLLLHWLAPVRLRNCLLLAASILFYAWGEHLYVLVMLVSITWNYFFGLLVSTGRRNLLALGVAVAGNLALLVSFKYANFLADNLNSVLAVLGLPGVDLAPVHLPIGISFFTFQAMSYVVDVYRGQAEAQRNPLKTALYISLFPQLIAGPIVRYKDIARQLTERRITIAGLGEGARRFILGLAKKMIIANTVALAADRVFALPGDQMSPGVAWLGVACYTLQIYFDFSGYSDMAIGLGRMFGFRFRENFRYPYVSRSITEFWRRWHISLSTWFRDYLYIPLGGNRRGPLRTYANLFLVFFLCGLWHGASWNFVVWGLFHGAFLVFERMVGSPVTTGPWAVLRHVRTIFVVMIGWVFFRAETLGEAADILVAMSGFASSSATAAPLGLFLDTQVALAMVAGSVLALPVLPFTIERMNRWLAGASPTARRVAGAASVVVSSATLGLLCAYCVLLSLAGTYNPFIYFRF